MLYSGFFLHRIRCISEAFDKWKARRRAGLGRLNDVDGFYIHLTFQPKSDYKSITTSESSDEH